MSEYPRCPASGDQLHVANAPFAVVAVDSSPDIGPDAGLFAVVAAGGDFTGVGSGRASRDTTGNAARGDSGGAGGRHSTRDDSTSNTPGNARCAW